MTEYDAGNSEHQEVREKLQRLSRLEHIEWMRRTLDTYYGRAIVWNILSECHMNAPTYYMDGDQIAMHMREGARSLVGLWLQNEVFTSDPNAYNIMRNEAESRQSERDEREQKELKGLADGRE